MMNQIVKKIKNNLIKLVKKDIAQKIFDNNILSHSLTGYYSGKVLTFKKLKELNKDTILNIVFKDDYSILSSTYGELSKDTDEEWSIGAYPFPIKKLNDDDLIDNIYNGEEYFTIKEAINFN